MAPNDVHPGMEILENREWSIVREVAPCTAHSKGVGRTHISTSKKGQKPGPAKCYDNAATVTVRL